MSKRGKGRGRGRSRDRERRRMRHIERRYAALESQIQALPMSTILDVGISLIKPQWRSESIEARGLDEGELDWHGTLEDADGALRDWTPDAVEEELVFDEKDKIEAFQYRLSPTEKDKCERLYEAYSNFFIQHEQAIDTILLAEYVLERWARKWKKPAGAMVSPPWYFLDEFRVQAEKEREKQAGSKKKNEVVLVSLEQDMSLVAENAPYEKVCRTLRDSDKMWGRFAHDAKTYRRDLVACMRDYLEVLDDQEKMHRQRKKIANHYIEVLAQDEGVVEEEVERFAEYPLYSMYLTARLVQRYGQETARKVMEVLTAYAEGDEFKYRSSKQPKRFAETFACDMDVAQAACGLWHALPRSFGDDFWKGFRRAWLGELMPQARYFKVKPWEVRGAVDFNLYWDEQAKRYKAHWEKAVEEKFEQAKALENSAAAKVLQRLQEDYAARRTLVHYICALKDTALKDNQLSDRYERIEDLLEKLDSWGMATVYFDMARAIISAFNDELRGIEREIGDLTELYTQDEEKGEDSSGVVNTVLELGALKEKIKERANKLRQAIKEVDSPEGKQGMLPETLHIDQLLSPLTFKVLRRRHKDIFEENTESDQAEMLDRALIEQLLNALNQITRVLDSRSRQLFTMKARLVEALATRQREYLVSGDLRDKQNAPTRVLMAECGITMESLVEEQLYRKNEKKANGKEITQKEHEKYCLRMVDRWLMGTTFRLADPGDGRVFRGNNFLLRGSEGIHKKNQKWNLKDGKVRFNTHRILGILVEILQEKGEQSREKLRKALVEKGVGLRYYKRGGEIEWRTVSDGRIKWMVEQIQEYGWWRRYEW